MTHRDRLGDRNGGLPRLSDGVARASRCPASPRRTLLAENLGKPSLWVIITEIWYKGAPGVAKGKPIRIDGRARGHVSGLFAAVCWTLARMESERSEPATNYVCFLPGSFCFTLGSGPDRRCRPRLGCDFSAKNGGSASRQVMSACCVKLTFAPLCPLFARFFLHHLWGWSCLKFPPQA
jgi:hypothetical protein